MCYVFCWENDAVINSFEVILLIQRVMEKKIVLTEEYKSLLPFKDPFELVSWDFLRPIDCDGLWTGD